MLAHSTDSTKLYLEIPILLLCYTILSFFYTATKKYRNFIINFIILVRYLRAKILKKDFPGTLSKNIFRRIQTLKSAVKISNHIHIIYTSHTHHIHTTYSSKIKSLKPILQNLL